jgi:transcription initiation factor TFIIIB Brf1 subunit/transcription initiation factor TFIIB
MPYCTECGGKLVWDRKLRQYSCQSCGMTFTEPQLSAARDKIHAQDEDDEELRRRRHIEYLDWWFKDKKDRR